MTKCPKCWSISKLMWKQEPWWTGVLYTSQPPTIDMYPVVIDDVEYNEIYECPVHGEFATNPAGGLVFILPELWVHGPNGRIVIGEK